MMIFSKIIFFSQGRFTTRDYDRFGIEQFLKRNFQVEIYDLSAIAQSGWYAQNHPRQKEVFDHIIKEIKKVSEIEEELEENEVDKTLIISYIALNLKTKPIYSAISKLNFQYAGLLFGLLPYHRQPDFLKYLVLLKQSLDFRYKYKDINPATFMLISGTEGKFKSQYKVGHSTQFVYASSFDYRTFIQESNSPTVSERNEAVFLDEYYPYHPDLKGIIIIDPEAYYLMLNRFFEKFENKYGVNVVIAGHPKADYTKNNPFEGREILFGETASMVRSCKYVLTHSSTAVSFAVLWKKPVLVLNFKKVLFHLEGKMTDKFAKTLGTDLVYLDTSYSMDFKMNVNQKKYRDYKNRFVKASTSQNQDCWEDLMDFLAVSS